MDNSLNFDSAPHRFATVLVQRLGVDAASNGRIVRDIYGHLSFVTSEENVDQTKDFLGEVAAELGVFGDPTSGLFIAVDDKGLKAFLEEPSVAIELDAGVALRLIDRRLAGQDWLMRAVSLSDKPHRLVFYSIKGGVGRSTALAITAADLSARGLNVLVIDLDMEAPGLGSLLLHDYALPNYGVVDWFAAVAAGCDVESMIPDMVGPSPFTSSRAIVDVVPAAGKSPGAYLSKLARAYTPGSAGVRYAGLSFPEKANLLITQLCAIQRYDVVLIDARAGLHETSGGIVLGLGARALLFGVDTSQTFDDFGLLFGAFKEAFDPNLKGEDLRRSIKMVHGKAPRDERELERFRERSWAIWSEFLYDDIDPLDEVLGSSFVFDLSDDNAPHYPLEIIGDDTYARFDPRSETYALDADAYAPIFGRFLNGVRSLLELK